MARYLRRTAFYKLNPPAVVSAPSTFVARAVQTELARSRRPISASRLGEPAVVNPAVTNYGPQRKLAPHPRQARAAHFVLRPPATLVAPVVPFIARGIQTRFGTSIRRAVQQHYVTPQLYPPDVIDGLPATFGPDTKLARAPRQARVTQSDLRPPAVLGVPVVVFTAPPLRTSFRVTVRRRAEQHFTTSTLFPPEIVNPLPATFGTATKLARTPRQARVTRSVLRAPTITGVVVVTPPFRPLAVNFVTAVRRSARKRPALSSELRPPTVVSIPSGDNPTGGIFDPNYFLIIHS